jgi:hypothetical protein
MSRRGLLTPMRLALTLAVLCWGAHQGWAQSQAAGQPQQSDGLAQARQPGLKLRSITNADREAAAARLAAARAAAAAAATAPDGSPSEGGRRVK